jgi:hypothetical protein
MRRDLLNIPGGGGNRPLPSSESRGAMREVLNADDELAL